MERPLVALGRKLERCPRIVTLGMREDFLSYTEEELDLIRRARLVFYPGKRFIDSLAATGKPTFPTEPSYRLGPDRIKQSALFRLLGIRTPKTWILFGKRHKTRWLDDLPLPLVVKPPRRGALGKGVRLLTARDELEAHLAAPGVAYLQEYIPQRVDLRVVVINFEVVHHYFRIAAAGDFRSSYPTGDIVLGPAAEPPLKIARSLAKNAGLSPICVDFMESRGEWLVVDIGLLFGLPGFSAAGLDPYEIICKMVEKGQL